MRATVRSKEKTVGVCYLDNPLSSYVFTEEDLELMRVIMSQAAIAIENASLYSDLEKATEKHPRTQQAYSIIKTDLGIAKRIQENIMPGTSRQVGDLHFHARFYPMSEVGATSTTFKQLSKDLIAFQSPTPRATASRRDDHHAYQRANTNGSSPSSRDVNELLEILK